jgi:hypothetical protein
VKGLALELVCALDTRHRWRRNRTDRGDQKLPTRAVTILYLYLPAYVGFIIGSRRDAAIETDVFAQVEFVCNEIEISQGFRLRGKMFAPVPFAQNLFGERIAVTVALRIKTRARVAVPVPGSTYSTAGFEYPNRKSKLSEPM